MAIVKMYKAADGSLHETFDAFAKREAELKMKPQLEALAAAPQFVCDGGVFEADDRGNHVLFPENIPSWVIVNADKLREILNGATVSRRGRKSA